MTNEEKRKIEDAVRALLPPDSTLSQTLIVANHLVQAMGKLQLNEVDPEDDDEKIARAEVVRHLREGLRDSYEESVNSLEQFREAGIL